MNPFKSNSTPNLGKILAAAQFSVPAADLKTFNASVDAMAKSLTDLESGRTALQNAEGLTPAIAGELSSEMQRVGDVLAAGGLTEEQAADALRSARNRSDLHDAKVGGLRRKVTSLEAAALTAAEDLREAKNRLTLAIRQAIRRRLAEVATPFASALRVAYAIDATLGLGMEGLSRTEIHDPEYPMLHEEFVGCGVEFPFQHQDAMEMAESLAPFSQMSSRAEQMLLQAENDRRVLDIAQADARRKERDARLTVLPLVNDATPFPLDAA